MESVADRHIPLMNYYTDPIIISVVSNSDLNSAYIYCHPLSRWTPSFPRLQTHQTYKASKAEKVMKRGAAMAATGGRAAALSPTVGVETDDDN